MPEVKPLRLVRTGEFQAWYGGLRDRRAKTAITARLVRLEQGLRGDTRAVGDGVSELRIDYGPGYRIYYTQRGGELIVLLCGGDKSSQARDILAAKSLAREVRNDG